LQVIEKITPFLAKKLIGGSAIRSLPRDGGAEEFRGDSTAWSRSKVWTTD